MSKCNYNLNTKYHFCAADADPQTWSYSLEIISSLYYNSRFAKKIKHYISGIS
jgi:hypothetical protein